MQIDLYLPCIAFQVEVRPGDSSRPTDLELAALHFIDQTEDKREDNARQLERFLGLGSAVFQDLLIRMVNRCWVLLGNSEASRVSVLRLSDAARDAMRNGRLNEMSPIEQGRKFTVCYDLLGGGFAVIPPRFRTKAMAESAALQPVRGHKSDALYRSMPYRKPLNGFLAANGTSAEPVSARILQALQSDRSARGYLREQGGITPTLHIAPPGKVLSWNDVEFYRCRFNVFSSGHETHAGQSIPRLECVERRNATVRKLGLGNAQAIVEDALEGTDSRLITLLRKSMEQHIGFQRAPTEPIEALIELARRQDTSGLVELKECWDVARERVQSIASSRLDLVAPVDHDGIRQTVAEMAQRPDALLLVGSPLIRSSSPELSVHPQSFLSSLTKGSAVPLIHGTRGASMRGVAFSDETAIGRLITALPAAKLHVEGQSLDHVRTPILADDRGQFVWLAESPFGGQGPRIGLRLDFAAGCEAHGFAHLVQALPWSLQDWIANAQAEQPVASNSDLHLPKRLAERLREVEAIFATLGDELEVSPEDQARALKDLAERIEAIDSWIRIESDSAEFVSGAEIQTRMAAMLEPRGDHQALVLGLSGRSDLRFLADITNQVCARLSRQDLAGIDDAPLHIFLPVDAEAAEQIDMFKQRVGQSGARHQVVVQALQPNQPRPTAFALAPAKVLIAHDGIVRFIPTIGRTVKGIQLAVQFNGRQVEREVAQFLATQWPDAAIALAAVRLKETVPEPGLSHQRLKQLIESANREQWFEDGNVGAATLAHNVRKISDPAAWGETLDLAVKLLAPTGAELGDQKLRQRLGYAHLKAVATAPEIALELSAVARAQMAELAANKGDVLVAAILSDQLPEESPFRDPLVRKLAYALARQIPPELTSDDELALTSPTAPVACLSGSLMLDGKGEQLITSFRNCDLSGLGAEAAVAKALALYLSEHEFRSIEDLGVDPGVSHDDIDRVVSDIVSQIRSAAQRRVGGLPPFVLALRDDLFNTAGAFTFEVGKFFDKDWPRLSMVERAHALQVLLKSATSDLGIDLFASVSNNDEIQIDRVANEYFDRKNEEGARRARAELVDLTKSGRFMPVTISSVLKGLVETIIPELIKATDSSASQLAEAISVMESGATDEINPQLQKFRKILSARLEGPAGRDSYISPIWRFPALPAAKRPDWPVLAEALLKYEFPGDSNLAKVIDWFLEKDRNGDELGRTNFLVTVSDLLEVAQASIDSDEHNRLSQRLRVYLGEKGAADDADAARAFEAASGRADAKLANAARAIHAERKTIDRALHEGDLVGAILGAGTLHEYQNMLATDWREITVQVLNDIAAQQDEPVMAELRSLLSDYGKASQLVEARAYLALRPYLTRRIELDGIFQVEIFYGNLPGDAPDGTRALMETLTKTRREAGTPIEDGNALAQMLMEFVSDLDATELLPKAVCRDDVWRISSSHPAAKALTLMHGECEFLVAKTRDAEIAIRAQLRRAAHSTNAAEGLKGLAGFTETSSRPNQPILLALFNSQPVAGAAMLPWRLLALLGRENTRNRRIGVLGELSRQKFGEASSLRRWWRGLDDTARLAALAALLELPQDELAGPPLLSQLIEWSGDACLALGLFIAADREFIQLSEAGRRVIASIWSKHCDLKCLGNAVDMELLLEVMDAVFETCAP